MLTLFTIAIIVSQIHHSTNLPSNIFEKSSEHKTVDKDHPTRQKKAPNIPLPITHHLLFPSQLHVLPARSNVYHNTVHTELKHVVANNIQIPVITHTVSHSSTNITHPTKLIPLLVPVHHLVPVHDLTVIPLRHGEQKAGFRSVMGRDDNVNRYRTYYGGFGNGLFFGGHGAGHGFYAYG